MKSALGDPGIPQPVAEVANDKQEWEICDIIAKEDADGVPHYWVQWSATLLHWSPHMKWGRRGLWWLDSRHNSKHKVSKGVEKDEGGCFYRTQASRQLEEFMQQERRNRRKGEVDLRSRCKASDR